MASPDPTSVTTQFAYFWSIDAEDAFIRKSKDPVITRHVTTGLVANSYCRISARCTSLALRILAQSAAVAQLTERSYCHA